MAEESSTRTLLRTAPTTHGKEIGDWTSTVGRGDDPIPAPYVRIATDAGIMRLEYRAERIRRRSWMLKNSLICIMRWS